MTEMKKVVEIKQAEEVTENKEIKQDTNVETTDVLAIETEVVEESKLDKVKAFGKKHWTKLAVGAGVIGAGILIKALGSCDKRLEDEETELHMIEGEDGTFTLEEVEESGD